MALTSNERHAIMKAIELNGAALVKRVRFATTLRFRAHHHSPCSRTGNTSGVAPAPIDVAVHASIGVLLARSVVALVAAAAGTYPHRAPRSATTTAV